MTPLQTLLQGLTAPEVQELEQLASYLGQHSQGGTKPAEGSLSAAINKASPDVQAVLKQLVEVLETPRNMPFQDKLSPEMITDVLGLDQAGTGAAKTRLDEEYITAELARRADARGGDRNPAAPTLRQQVEAAYMANGGQ